jgi:hypothetical protein
MSYCVCECVLHILLRVCVACVCCVCCMSYCVCSISIAGACWLLLAQRIPSRSFVVQEYVGSNECSACLKGQYSDAIGQSDCKPCRACTASLLSGCGGSSAGVCKACGAGQFIHPGTHACRACTACMPGMARENCAGNVAGVCKSCPKGRYKHFIGAGGDACKECPTGRYQEYTAQRRCFACPQGKHQIGSGASTCELGAAPQAAPGVDTAGHKIGLFKLPSLEHDAGAKHATIGLSALPGLGASVGNHLDLSHLPAFGTEHKHKINLRELSKMSPVGGSGGR